MRWAFSGFLVDCCAFMLWDIRALAESDYYNCSPMRRRIYAARYWYADTSAAELLMDVRYVHKRKNLSFFARDISLPV